VSRKPDGAPKPLLTALAKPAIITNYSIIVPDSSELGDSMGRKLVIKTNNLSVVVLVLLCWTPQTFAYVAPLQDVTSWVDGSTFRYHQYFQQLFPNSGVRNSS
jgi:hypothetical protein